MAGTMVLVEKLHATELTPQSHELLHLANALKSDGAGPVWALCFGNIDTNTASQLSADRITQILFADGDASEYNPSLWISALHSYVEDNKPDLILLPNNTVGIDLAPALSILTNYPLISYCTDLAFQDSELVARAEIYYGRIHAFLNSKAPAIVAANHGVTHAGRAIDKPRPDSAKPSIETQQVSSERGGSIRVLDKMHPDPNAVDITKSEKIVSIGRGVGEQENISRAQSYADALKAELSCSRPLVDLGWMPKERQVGKSGVAVAPKLYLALGISGAPEHLQGMADSELIVAINSDENAPIFNVAHYAIVDDFFNVMDEVIQRLGERNP